MVARFSDPGLDSQAILRAVQNSLSTSCGIGRELLERMSRDCTGDHLALDFCDQRYNLSRGSRIGTLSSFLMKVKSWGRSRMAPSGRR